MARMRAGLVKLRREVKEDGYPSYLITVPREVGDRLDHLVGRAFECRLTDEGIVFHLSEESPSEAPSWVGEG